MINKINTSNWKEFKIFYNSKNNKGLFKISVGGDTAKINSYMTPSDNINDKVCIVSNTAVNNGIVDEIKGFKTNNKNVITLATRGNDYKAFYHKNYYVIPVIRTICLAPVNFILNDHIAFFLCTIFYQNAYKYGYSRFLSGERIKKDNITLPAKQNKEGKYEPDWEFMEDYIKSISKKVNFSDTIQVNNNELPPLNTEKPDTTNWQEFRIDDLFYLRKGERLVEIDRIIGDAPLVTASFYNNGITSHIDFEVFENTKKIFRNKITVDIFANVFFHSYDYFSDDNIHSLVLKSDKELNIYVNLFLVSIIKKLQPRYGFGRQVRLHRLMKEIIKLPVKQNSNGKYEPDWQFMEDYIKSLPYSSNL